MTLLGFPSVTSSKTSRSRGVKEAKCSRDLVGGFKFSANRGIALECALHTIDEVLIAKGLLQKIECTILHGFYRHRDVAVAADEHDGNSGPAQVQFLEQLQATHSRHADIEH